MSYTGGYTVGSPAAVCFDLRAMGAILDINQRDMTVTLQAGVTWARLHDALAPLGLRTPFWGPLSGISSTVGGGLSQNNAFFGAGLYGAASESVISVCVVLADGSIVRAGSAGAEGAKPFFRHFGPDLTGLFLGDCGAFGLKTELTLRLIEKPAHEGWASFSFQAPSPWVETIAAIARSGVASETFGFDPNLTRVRMKRASLMADASALVKVMGAQKSILAGIREGAKTALAGRSFLDGTDYSVHVAIEGQSKGQVDAGLARVRMIASQEGGLEVENTIPKVVRAQPFTPLNSMLGPSGERWAPVHGIVSHSSAQAAFNALEAVFAERAGTFETHDITTGYLVTTLSTNGFLIEPVFYWPDEIFAVHEASIEPAHLQKLPRHPANLEARAAVREARQAVIDTFASFGAAHFQVGRAYPLLASRSEGTAALYRALKLALDPKGIMNPGVLGL
jgi:FAD/FMN-containing dehydrogenase